MTMTETLGPMNPKGAASEGNDVPPWWGGQVLRFGTEMSGMKQHPI